MIERLKEQIKTGVGLWVISWIGTIIILLNTKDKLDGAAILFVCDVIFPIITLNLIYKLKKLKKTSK